MPTKSIEILRKEMRKNEVERNMLIHTLLRELSPKDLEKRELLRSLMLKLGINTLVAFFKQETFSIFVEEVCSGKIPTSLVVDALEAFQERIRILKQTDLMKPKVKYFVLQHLNSLGTRDLMNRLNATDGFQVALKILAAQRALKEGEEFTLEYLESFAYQTT
jgi:hypothetical protein